MYDGWDYNINIQSEYYLYGDEEISWYGLIYSLLDYIDDGIFPDRKTLDRIIYLLRLSHYVDIEPEDTNEYINRLYDWANTNKVWIRTVF